MAKYRNKTACLVAVDCIVFGFDGQHLKILLVQRGFEPEKGKWSLMGGFVEPHESADEAATRILHELTGLEGVYLEQLHTFSLPDRDPIQRTVSIAYFALIDIQKYEKQMSPNFRAEWFMLTDVPHLIFDHDQMVAQARQKLRYKAAMHPLLFELLPGKFTIPGLQTLFEEVFDTTLDKGNFSRKLVGSGMLIRQADKDKAGSKKGAFYYKLNMKQYKKNFHKVQAFVPGLKQLI